MPAAADDDADGAADDIACRTKLNLLLLFLFIYHYVDCDVALSCCRHLRSFVREVVRCTLTNMFHVITKIIYLRRR